MHRQDGDGQAEQGRPLGQRPWTPARPDDRPIRELALNVLRQTCRDGAYLALRRPRSATSIRSESACGGDSSVRSGTTWRAFCPRLRERALHFQNLAITLGLEVAAGDERVAEQEPGTH